MAKKERAVGRDWCAEISGEDRFARMAEGLKREYFFYCHGVDGVFTYVSPSVTNILGYTVEEFLGNFDKYLTPNPANKAVLSHTRRSIKGVRQPPYEVEVCHKDGSTRTLEVLEMPVRRGSRVVAVEGIAKDITGQKHLEELLRRHGLDMEEQARIILQSSGDGIVGVDKEGRISFLNEAAGKMLGWKPEELKGRPLHETIHYKRADGSPYPRADCPMNAAMVLGRETRLEDVLWRRDGSSFPAAYSTRPIMRDGAIMGAVITFSDISGRRRLEEIKSLLSHAILHDLNTPLAVIVAGAEMASECPASVASCVNRDTLAAMSEAAVEMKNMLSDILDIARMEEGALRLCLAPVSPAKLLTRVAEKIAPVAAAKSRRIVTSAGKGLRRVTADEHLLTRVLDNLLGNALRYSPAAAPVTVAASAGEGGEVVFSVSDRGRGIAPEHLGRIFEKFFQVDNGVPVGRQGKGLGLAFCRLVVESHGGRIWAENLPEGGCRFSFTLGKPRRQGKRNGTTG